MPPDLVPKLRGGSFTTGVRSSIPIIRIIPIISSIPIISRNKGQESQKQYS